MSQIAFLGGAETYFLGGFLLAYFVGGLPIGLLVARAFGLGDLRRLGSGNPGATNVLRAGSAQAAALTLVLDVLKGAVPVALAYSWYGPNVAAFAGFGAFLGHCYSPYLRLWGGKGVATGFGVFLAWDWPVALACAAIWILVAAITRYSSLAALTVAAAAAPLFALFERWELLPLVVAMTLILIMKHAGNIRRLIRGEESRISFGATDGAGR